VEGGREGGTALSWLEGRALNPLLFVCVGGWVGGWAGWALQMAILSGCDYLPSVAVSEIILVVTQVFRRRTSSESLTHW